VGPLVFQLIEDFNLAERTQNAGHEARFADRALDSVEAGAHGAFGSHHAGDRASDFAKHIVCSRHGFLARCQRVGHLFCGLQPRVDDWHSDHENTVLHGRRQHGNLRKQALVCRSRHDLVWISLTATVGTNEGKCGTKKLDKVPAGTGDGE
jgi:hypothetical protein